MTRLRPALERYLSMRQGLGYKYQHQARRLASFVSFMEERNATTITTKLAVAWATLPPDRRATWALRLTDVRGFARHVANTDPETEVPASEACSTLCLRRCGDQGRCWRRHWLCRLQTGYGDGPTITCSG
jgi:hypothetical protein